MPDLDLRLYGRANEHFIKWCLEMAQQQIAEDFSAIRQIQCSTARYFVAFCSNLPLPHRTGLMTGLICRGLDPKHFTPQHQALWTQYRAFALREDSREAIAQARRWRINGKRVIRLLQATWGPEALGVLTAQEKNELNAELMDQGWKLETWVEFDRFIGTYYRLWEPGGKVHLERTSFLSWIGIYQTVWDDARRGSEAEVAQQVRRLLETYSKPFLHHFSRADPADGGE